MNTMGQIFSKASAPLRLLELFSGTGSVGKVGKKEGYKVTSVDMNRKAKPTFCTDILKWDYKQFPRGHFDMIWASPPCDTFSHLLVTHIGKPCKKKGYEGRVWSHDLIVERQEQIGLPILNKVKEIIEYFQPKHFFIENPQTGRMKNYMTEYKHTDVCYCMYGFDYKKPTRFWHNNNYFTGLMCDHKGKHARVIGTGDKQVQTLNERYSIPPQLVEDVFECVDCALD